MTEVYFNSRPHGGRRKHRVQADGVESFQLTPSRRATIAFFQSRVRVVISTHALTEGDTQICPSQSLSEYFNSRPHGGRHNYSSMLIRTLNFNSRPHGGRHETRNERREEFSYFNSRPHGGRQIREGHRITKTVFQLTPSRRATITAGELVQQACNFNSRPHGGRHVPTFHPVSSNAFQLTPSRRATSGAGADEPREHISTHALTEGDLEEVTAAELAQIFQLTPSRRAT